MAYFSNQNSQFGLILDGIAMEYVGIFNSHLVYFIAIWYIYGHLVYLWPFGIFFAFWYICYINEKSGNPDCIDSSLTSQEF
jgi:hypothetical protein